MALLPSIIFVCVIFLQGTIIWLKSHSAVCPFFNRFAYFIEINFINFAQDYYYETKSNDRCRMTVSSISFLDCSFDNWELNYPLASSLKRIHFSRMLFLLDICLILLLLLLLLWLSLIIDCLGCENGPNDFIVHEGVFKGVEEFDIQCMVYWFSPYH